MKMTHASRTSHLVVNLKTSFTGRYLFYIRPYLYVVAPSWLAGGLWRACPAAGGGATCRLLLIGTLSWPVLSSFLAWHSGKTHNVHGIGIAACCGRCCTAGI